MQSKARTIKRSTSAVRCSINGSGSGHLKLCLMRLAVSLSGLLLMLLISSCGNPIGEHHPEWQKYFDEAHVSGCIEIFDLKHAKYIDYNPDRCAQRFVPASTFKICNALIALETKTIADTATVIHWDSVERSIASWNHDQNLSEAFRNSCTPCFQQLAHQVGIDNYSRYLNVLHYGNMQTGNVVDSFWLNGALRISCDEQVEFLNNLYSHQMKISDRSIGLVKAMMVMEKTPAYTLSGKTGWGTMKQDMIYNAPNEKPKDDIKNIGWFVGYVEKGSDVFVFALNIESPDPVPDNWLQLRVDITKKVLTDLKIL